MVKYLFLFFSCFSIYAQCDNPLGDALHKCRVDKIMEECRKWYSIDDNEVGLCLSIYNKDEFDLFISKIDNYKNLKALILGKFKVNDFEFLKHLEQLEYVSIDFNRSHNFASLVENLNKTKVHALEIRNFNNVNYLKWFNQLTQIKSVAIQGSNLKRMNITLSLDHLIISKSKRLRFIDVTNVVNLSLDDNELKTIPEGLSESKALKALHFYQYRALQVNCPVDGFKNLEYLNLFATKSNRFDSSCFPDNLNVRIQLFPEY